MANEDQMSWQRQNMKKTGAHTLSVGSMHPKLCMADGGSVDEATLKQEGLAASAKDAPVGFFKRLSQGNIDDPSSEAYSNYGAGRGRIERGNAAQGANELDAAAISARQSADIAIANASPSGKHDMGEMEGVDDAVEKQKNSAPAPVKAKPVAKPAAKPAPAPAADARDMETGNSRGSRSFAADVAERKSKSVAISGGSDTKFDASALNFASSKPAVKPAAQEDKNKARPISRSRAYYSGNS